MITFKQTFMLATLFMASFHLTGQQLTIKGTDMPLSKNAKKSGMYVQTVIKDDNSLATFISYDVKKDLGFDVITVDKNGNVTGNSEEIVSSESAKKYGVSIPSPGKVAVPGAGREVLAIVGSIGAMGKFKIKRGTFEPKYANSVDYSSYGSYSVTTYTPILRGFKFEEKEEVKTGHTAGVFTIFPHEEEIERNYNIIEGMISGTVGYVPANSSAAFLGAVVEAVNIKNPSEYAGNRLIHGVFDGKTMKFTKENNTIFPYTFQTIAKSNSAEGNKAILVVANKLVTTYAPQKQWAPSSPKLMSILSINKEGDIVDNVTWESLSVRGTFHMSPVLDANYVLGMVNNAHDGYYRFDIGKVTDFQITKVKGGQVEYNKSFSLDQMSEKWVNGKGKLKLPSNMWCSTLTDLPNGDILAIYSSPSDYLLMQLTAGGDLISTYTVPRVPGKELSHYDNLTHVSGENVYLVFREQSGAISQGVTKSFSRSSGSYMKDVNFTRIDEVMAYASIVKLNPKSKSISNPVSTGDLVLLGSYPVFDGADGTILLPARDTKGNYKMYTVK